MSDLVEVVFKEDGKWADNPSDPVFDVKAGDKKMVSSSLANALMKSGKGNIVDNEVEATKTNPAQADKASADKGHTKNSYKGNQKGRK